MLLRETELCYILAQPFLSLYDLILVGFLQLLDHVSFGECKRLHGWLVALLGP